MSGPLWRNRPLALIGLSGCGKSTIGLLLARRLGWTVFDVDAAIVQASGLSAADYFAQHGEPAFRREESRQLAVGVAERRIVACGGGIVLDPDNRRLLHEAATVVWLDAPDAVILARLLRTSEARPNLAGDAAARLAAQRAVRAPLYASCADLRIDTAATEPELLADQVLRLLDQEALTRPAAEHRH